MEFQDVVRKRRMVRNFDPAPVDPEVLERILQNALHAPSAGFSQGWGFLCLTQREDLDLFWEVNWPGERRTGPHTGVAAAPVVIVPFSNKEIYLDRYAEPDKGWTDRDESRWPVPFWDIDTGMAVLLILLTAVDAGLGAVYFGIHDPAPLRESFGVPPGYKPIGAIAIGHRAPDELSPSLKRGRRGVDEVVHRGRW